MGRQVAGADSGYNQIPYPGLDDPQPGKQMYGGGSPKGVRVLGPTSGSPVWGSCTGKEDKPPEHLALKGNRA